MGLLTASEHPGRFALCHAETFAVGRINVSKIKVLLLIFALPKTGPNT
jgi:hypothetical protein